VLFPDVAGARVLLLARAQDAERRLHPEDSSGRFRIAGSVSCS
jgi:hypothetical protein